MADKRKSNEFTVKLGDVNLPPAVADRLDKAVRRAALDVIVNLDLSDDRIDFHIPREWRGIILDLSRVKIGGNVPT